MPRLLTGLLVLGVAGISRGAETAEQLPTPHYHREAADPDWLSLAAQFHGHLGPWVTAGVRMGMAGRRAVAAEGYFDVEVTCEGPFTAPPRSCFLDGLQLGAGATLGKRNLHWQESEAIVVRVKNTLSGGVAEVRPAPQFLAMMASLKPQPMARPGTTSHDADHEGPTPVETLARSVANAPAEDIFTITVSAPQ